MDPSVGGKIAVEMKRRGTGPKLWARSRGHSPRTVNQLLHHGLGSVRGGEKTNAVFADLIREGYIDESHEFVEPQAQAS